VAGGKRDYYEVLGVERSADADALKKAYKKLAIQLHPDRNKAPDAEERFKELSEAYAVLSDADKKARYDQFGHAGIDQQYSSEDLYRTINFNDLFGGMGGFGDLFGQMFGGSRNSGPSRGRDLQTAHAITLEEAFAGTEVEVTYWRLEGCGPCKGSGAEPGSKVDTCPTCRGTGQVQRLARTAFGTLSQVTSCPECGGEGKRFERPCRTCKGSGHDRHRRTVSVSVPAGIESGQVLRMAGQGEVGGKGGPYGDLYVEIQVKEHDRFDREGPDLLTEAVVSFPEAVLGTTVTLATLDGSANVEVPAGTPNGKVLRLRGRGMPHLRGAGRGDLHVAVRVAVPEKVSDHARQLLEELGKELGADASKMGKRKKGLFG
jgi:molecular chaperone DnaJ